MINNKYYAIDCHCHIYPEKIASRAVGGTDAFYGSVSVGSGLVEDMLARADRAGIDRALVQSVATTPHQVRSINNFIAAEVAKCPDRLIGFGALHPASEDIEGDLLHLISLGLRGVKLHPDIQDFKIDDYRALTIYEACERHGVPILFHAGDGRYDRSNPNRLVPVLRIYNRLNVIAAHFGGYSIWDQAVEALAGMPNLYVDCSSAMPFLTDDKIREYIRRYGEDRVLFGTDYPMWTGENEVPRLLSLGLSDEAYRKIFSENAMKLLGL